MINESKYFNRSFLSSESFLLVNKRLIKIFGLDCAIFLSDLISKELYFENKNQIDSEGFFFNTQENRSEDTGLSPYKQTASIEKLKEINVLSVKRIGLPARQYFKINHDELKSHLLNFKGSFVKNLISETIYNKNKEIKSILKNTIASDDTDVIISHQIKRRVKPPIINFPVKRGTPCYEFVRSWNEGSGRHTKHDLLSESKTLKNIKRYYSQLSSGKFFKDKIFNPDWLKRNPSVNQKIKQWKETSYRFTTQELLDGITLSLLYFQEGNWPQNKSSVPKSLTDMIYNPRSQTSWFLKAMISPPGILSSFDSVDDLYPLFNGMVLDVIKEEQTPRAIGLINKFFSFLEETYQHTVNKNPDGLSYTDFIREFPNWEQFCVKYIHWVNDQEWITRKDWGCFDKDSGVVKKYFMEINQEYRFGDENFKIYTK